MLAANLDTSKIAEFNGTDLIQKSIVLNIRGVNVGFIGYLTPTTKSITPPNDVNYFDEILSIKYVSGLIN